MTSVEQSVEWELAGETEVLGEDLPHSHFAHHKSHMTWPELEPGPPRWEASDLLMDDFQPRVIKSGLTYHSWVFNGGHSLEQQRSWDADGRFVCEEIPFSYLNPKVHSFVFTWAHRPEPDEHSLYPFPLHFDIDSMCKCT
jgi:hypothetical protein